MRFSITPMILKESSSMILYALGDCVSRIAVLYRSGMLSRTYTECWYVMYEYDALGLGKLVCTTASVCRERWDSQVRRFTGSVDASRHSDFGRVLLSPSRLFINSRVIGIIIDKLMFTTSIFSRLLWPIVQFLYIYNICCCG